jgi:RNA polymerase sigma-70 factor (ECF subfamily)
VDSAERATAVVTELFESWYTPMLRFAARSTQNEQVAEEIVQEAFTELYKELRSGRKIQHPKAWAMRVIRRRIWREYIAPPTASLDTLAPPPAAMPVEHSELSMLLNQLTPRETEAVLLRAAGLGYAAIAKELGIATGTVSALLARALQRMQVAAKAASHSAQSRRGER